MILGLAAASLLSLLITGPLCRWHRIPEKWRKIFATLDSALQVYLLIAFCFLFILSYLFAKGS